jgi:excinuclease ABC subunit C
MEKRLRTFVEQHPEGWNHDQWLGLLADLEREGASTREPAVVGQELEKARLAWELDRLPVTGLGPKRRAALIDRFESMRDLRGASVEDVAQVPSINAALAQKVVQALR